MNISIRQYGSPDENHTYYDVLFYGRTIRTLVTSDPSHVEAWIDEVERTHVDHLNGLVVGFAAEWRRDSGLNRVATLQLCVNEHCLIVQLLHCPNIPQSLLRFLRERSYTFVGVSIEDESYKLFQDYNLYVRKTVDLSQIAANVTGVEALRNAGLMVLARYFMRLDVHKPPMVTMSLWDERWLTDEQVKYACLDAYLSMSLGCFLNASG